MKTKSVRVAMLRRFAYNEGFTLIELLMVLLVIAILTSAAVYLNFFDQKEKVHQSQGRKTVISILNDLNSYYLEFNEYPQNIQILYPGMQEDDEFVDEKNYYEYSLTSCDDEDHSTCMGIEAVPNNEFIKINNTKIVANTRNEWIEEEIN